MVIKKKTKKTKNDNRIKVVTPRGFFSFPYFVEPNTGRQYSDGKYSCDFFMTKEDFKNTAEGKALKDAVLTVARKHFGDQNLQLSDFAHPFKNTDKIDKYIEGDNDRLKGCIVIRCKSDFPPIMVDANKKELSEEAKKKVKGGDYGRLVVIAYPYTQDEGGVTLGLNLVQFQQAGESLGGGASEALSMIDEMEVSMEDVSEGDDDEEEIEEDEKPAKKVAKKAAKKVEVEEEDEDSDDDFDFEEDEEDEEPEKAEAREAKKDRYEAKGSYGNPKKKAGRPKKSDDEDEEF